MNLTIFGLLWQLINLLILGASIFLFILLVRLGLRGIKALDIYIAKNKIDNNR